MHRHSLFLIAALASAAHADTRVQLGTGAQYSDGEYGEATNTSAVFVPLYARVSHGAWAFQASVPYVRVSGPTALGELLVDDGGLDSHGGGSHSGSGSGSSDGGSGSSGGSGGSGGGSDDTPPPSPPPGADPDRDVAGLGDTSLSATYSLPRIAGSPLYLDLRARVRLPTGSRRDGLGTGATDSALLTELGVDARHGGAYVGGGRRFLGRVAGVERVDGWQAGAGAWWNATRHVTLGVDYDWRDPSTRDGIAPQSVTGYLAWRVNDVWKVELNAGAGLSDAAPDYSAGVTFTWRSGPL